MVEGETPRVDRFGTNGWQPHTSRLAPRDLRRSGDGARRSSHTGGSNWRVDGDAVGGLEEA